jgi:hypothetical protein
MKQSRPSAQSPRVQSPAGSPRASASRRLHVVPQPPSPDVAAKDAGYASVWKIWLPVVALLVLLDVTFNLYFWRIPKLSKVSSDYGYQFLVDARPLWQPAAPGRTRVLALGSSIALSFDPHQVESLLARSRPRADLDVHRLLLPGIHPSDYLAYFEDRPLPWNPDAVVVLVNLVDFLYPNTERDVNPTLRYILSPWKLLFERGEHMTVTGRLDSLLAGVSRLYRYRKPIRSSLHDHVRFALRRVGAGAARSAYGIYPDGHTKQRFAIPIEGQAVTLKYFIDPEWIRQRGAVNLEMRAGGDVVLARREAEAGWKTAEIAVAASAPRLLEVRADSAWVPRAGGEDDDARLLGVRLEAPPANARVEAPAARRYGPVPADDIDPFLRMGGKTGAEFARAWEETLQSNTRFGQRFRLYRDAKLALRDQAFDPGGEYEAARRLVELFRSRGSQVVVVNTPESPWILGKYRDGSYYKGYLEFFRGLSNSPGVHFHDWSEALPPEDFNDWHHPNYIGSIKLGERYAAVLDEVLRGH